MIGWAPVQIPGLAVSVWPACGVPDTVGGEVFTGGEGVEAPPLATLIVSTAMLNACAAVSLPIWTVETPAVPRLAAAVW